MTRDEILVVVIEEAAEVIKAATKIQRFGWDRNQPGYGINNEVLAMEIGDLLGAIDGLNLNDSNKLTIEYYRHVKMAKMENAHRNYGITK